MRCLVLGSLMISPMKTENIKSFWCSGPGRRYNHANGGRRERFLVRGVTAIRQALLIDTDRRVVRKNTAVDAKQESSNIQEIVRRLTAQTE